MRQTKDESQHVQSLDWNITNTPTMAPHTEPSEENVILQPATGHSTLKTYDTNFNKQRVKSVSLQIAPFSKPMSRRAPKALKCVEPFVQATPKIRLASPLCAKIKKSSNTLIIKLIYHSRSALLYTTAATSRQTKYRLHQASSGINYIAIQRPEDLSQFKESGTAPNFEIFLNQFNSSTKPTKL